MTPNQFWKWERAQKEEALKKFSTLFEAVSRALKSNANQIPPVSLPPNNVNRVNPLRDMIGVATTPEEVMNALQIALQNSQTLIPPPGSFCVFTYYAETPGLLYDRYPLVVVEKLWGWGFQGINYHWREPRNYRWDRLGSPIFVLKPKELSAAQALPLMQLIQLPY